MVKRLLGLVYKIVFFIENRYLKFRYYEYRMKYDIADEFRFNGHGIRFYGEGNISIGEKSYIGSYSLVQCAEGSTISIGSKCKISHNVRMYTTSSDPDQDFTSHNISTYNKNITIADGVWIGANVFISPGITIGKNSVIGANSVVTKDAEPHSIYAGVPAKKIRDKGVIK